MGEGAGRMPDALALVSKRRRLKAVEPRECVTRLYDEVMAT